MLEDDDELESFRSRRRCKQRFVLVDCFVDRTSVPEDFELLHSMIF
jgi:hypothetical protein